MIDTIILAEFDNNQGNVISLEYPNKTNIPELNLASYLIPEGTHNIMKDIFYCRLEPPLKNNSLKDIKKQEYIENYSLAENINLLKDKIKYNQVSFLDIQAPKKDYVITECLCFNDISNKWINMFEIDNTKLQQNNKNLNSSQFNLNISYNNKSNYYYIKISNYLNNTADNKSVLYIIPIHSELQFKKLNKTFASLYTLDHKAIGLSFTNDKDIEDLEIILSSKNKINKSKDDINEISLVYGPYDNIYNNLDNMSCNINNYISSTNSLYCIVFLNTIKNKSLQRGAMMKSIAICTKKIVNLYNFLPVASYLLDQIFHLSLTAYLNKSTTNLFSNIKSIVEKTYTSFNNQIPNSFFLINKLTKSLISTMSCNNYVFSRGLDSNYENIKEIVNLNSYLKSTLNKTSNLNSANNTINLMINNSLIGINISQSSINEKIFPGDIIHFLNIFKEKTLIIIDAIINDKTVMFIGSNSSSCESLSKCLFSITSIFNNNKFFILNKIKGIKNLYDLDYLNSPGAIYAVTNPIFKDKKDAWDIMCELDTGNVVINNSENKNKNSKIMFNYTYYKNVLDSNFINELLFKIKTDRIDEFEVEEYFKKYMNYLMCILSDDMLNTNIINSSLSHINITNKNNITDKFEEEVVNDSNTQFNRKMKLKNTSIIKNIKSYNNLLSCVKLNGVSIKEVDYTIKMLLFRKNIEKEELIELYTTLYDFLVYQSNINKESCVSNSINIDNSNKLLTGKLYPTNDGVLIFMHLIFDYTNDFHKIFYGIFSTFKEVGLLVCNLLDLLKKNNIAINYIFDKMNILFNIKTQSLSLNNFDKDNLYE